MLQRQSSVSSQGSAAGNLRGPSLQRRGSAGSMTERTFRSPSPNQPGPRSSSSFDLAPPVPPVPAKYNGYHPRERSASLDPNRNGVVPPSPRGRGSSVDARSSISSNRRPKSLASPLNHAAETERPGSRNSINFSRPLSPPNDSFPQQSKPKGSSLTTSNHPPPTAAEISKAEISNVQQAVSNAANAPVKKKKKKLAPQTVQGSHLAAGGVGGKPLGTAIAPSESFDHHNDSMQNHAQNPDNVQKESPVNNEQIRSSGIGPAEHARFTSDSDSDASESSLRDKRAQRASGILNKQPSVVREDWEGEQASRNGHHDKSPVGSPAHPPQSRKEAYAPNTTRPLVEAKTIQYPPSLVTTMPSPEIGTSQQQTNNLEPPTIEQARQPSLSPNRSRSARFSANLASELTAEGRHEPPPRSVSPAKSALKHHSPSSQTRSPIGDRGDHRVPSLTPSEASDTASHTSADGIGSYPRKKYHRVSFEMQPEVVGTATGGEHPTPAAGVDRKGLGLARPATLNTIPSDETLEEVFKPRPALPSFGSIRGKRDGGNRQSVPAESPSAPSSASSSVSNLPTTLDTSISSDHAIGGLLARDLRDKQTTSHHTLDPNEPLPPEVTSVEGTGYVSDEESISSAGADHHVTGTDLQIPDVSNLVTETSLSKTKTHAPESIQSLVGSSTKPTLHEAIDPESVYSQEVPQIAVQPATPASDGGDRWLVSIPGGFPSVEPEEYVVPGKKVLTTKTPPTAPEEIERVVEASSPSEIGIAEPKTPEAKVAQDPALPPVGSLSEALRLHNQEQDDSDSEGGSSIYSDAAEDLSDLEGDGFGSINAIVDSPVVPSPTRFASSPPDSPTGMRGTGGTSPGWDESQAHWSNLVQQQRMTKPRSPEPVEVSPMAVNSEKLNPKPKKKKTSQSAKSANLLAGPKANVPQPSVNLPRAETDAQPTSMRKSMRSTPSNNASEGPTMRAPGRKMGMKSSMRTSQQPAPQAPVAPITEGKGALQKRNIPAAVAPLPIASKPRQRRMSNDSDSSSSFRRSRRPKSSDGRYSMRRSMRGSNDSSAPPLPPAGRGVRSLSPPANRRPFSSGGTMRSSMRDSTDAPSLRGQQKFSGFGTGSSKPKLSTPAPAVSPTVANRFKSRFGNDSDEEDSPRQPVKFHSRFADSSDEEPEPLRPVRGIPRRTEEGDSTDLDDSSDDERSRRPKVQLATKKASDTQSQLSGMRRQPSNGSGRDLSKNVDQIPTSPKDKKKGIFGRFRSKKAKDDGKIGRNISESPARRDTHLERSKEELERARSPPAASPKGKLQRRNVPSRVTSDSWPLPPKIGEEGRPSTSDGVSFKSPVNGTQRPSHQRQDTSSTIQTADSAPTLGRGGKKKRFPMLRKAFGLHD